MSFKLLICLVLTTYQLVASAENKYKPVVMFHGLGDTAYGSINSLIKLTRRELNESIYVTSIEMGDGIRRDFFDSYFCNVNEELEKICKRLKEDEQLKDGFTLIGYSQGGQFSRALVQRCDIKVINLITLGAQHQGIFGLPKCPSEKHYICSITDRLFNIGFYNPVIQKRFVPAQYWHDANNETNYVEHSQFIAEINNEKVNNPVYKQRLTSVKKFVMIKFEQDTIVDPIDSAHFGFFAYGNLSRMIKMEDSRLYKEDRIGLKVLDESKRLIKMSVPGDHLQITRDWFKNEIINHKSVFQK